MKLPQKISHPKGKEKTCSTCANAYFDRLVKGEKMTHLPMDCYGCNNYSRWKPK